MGVSQFATYTFTKSKIGTALKFIAHEKINICAVAYQLSLLELLYYISMIVRICGRNERLNKHVECCGHVMFM